MRRTRQILSAVLIVFTASGFSALESLFAPSAKLWDKWLAHDPASTETVDHSAWAAFLETYLSKDDAGVHRVAYGKVTDADKNALHGYLESLRGVRVAGLNRDEQMAYWINLYNALTVRVVIQFYPVKSIQDIDLGSGLFGSGPWDRDLIRIDGEMISLNDIEHRILRPIWKDPRVHYALNCASVGCPNLADAPYTGAHINAQLGAAARAFVNSPRALRFTDDGMVISKIYTWFSEDFGGSAQMILDHLSRHASSDTEVKILQSLDINAYEYDWSLNDAAD